MIPEWTLGERLKKARESADMDQAQIAERLGVARSSVGRWEQGVTAVSRRTLVAWSMCTGVPTEWLLTGEAIAVGRTPDPAMGGLGKLPRLDSNQQPAD